LHDPRGLHNVNDTPDYQLSASVQDGITVVVITGEANENTIQESRRRVTAIIKEGNVRELLVDVRAFKGPRSYVNTYNRVRSYPRDLVQPRVAFVDTEENAEYRIFHETTARNAGVPLKCFTDIEAAKAWLKNK
jgi:hypothetical protein